MKLNRGISTLIFVSILLAIRLFIQITNHEHIDPFAYFIPFLVALIIAPFLSRIDKQK